MNFFEVWKHLNSIFARHNPSPHTRLVGYTLLAICNEHMLPEEFTASDRELQQRTGIKSVQSIVEARRYLKRLGAIDFTAKRGGTVYHMLCENQAPTEQKMSKNQSTGKHRSRSDSVSSISLREKKETETGTARAGAGGEGDEWASYRQY